MLNKSIYYLCFRILRMVDSGLILKWVKNHLPRENLCDPKLSSINHSKTALESTFGGFIALLVGLSVAVVTFALEVISAKVFKIPGFPPEIVISWELPEHWTKFLFKEPSPRRKFTLKSKFSSTERREGDLLNTNWAVIAGSLRLANYHFDWQLEPHKDEPC